MYPGRKARYNLLHLNLRHSKQTNRFVRRKQIETVSKQSFHGNCHRNYGLLKLIEMAGGNSKTYNTIVLNYMRKQYLYLPFVKRTLTFLVVFFFSSYFVSNENRISLTSPFNIYGIFRWRLAFVTIVCSVSLMFKLIQSFAIIACPTKIVMINRTTYDGIE